MYKKFGISEQTKRKQTEKLGYRIALNETRNKVYKKRVVVKSPTKKARIAEIKTNNITLTLRRHKPRIISGK